MNRRSLFSFALLALALQTAAHATTASEGRKLRIAVEGAYPPFSEVTPEGKLKGFDIDIANALCAQIKAECTLVQLEFDGMIPALQARKVDAIVASMSITPERQKQVLFTNKYYSTPARLVTHKDKPFDATPAAFKGKRIGVQRSTTHDRFATDTFNGAEIVRYTKLEEVFLDLASGRVDAALQDSVGADVGFLKKPEGKAFAFSGPIYDDAKYFGIGAGIALRKNETALQSDLNAAIKAIRADGRYKAMQDKYFKFDVYGKE